MRFFLYFLLEVIIWAVGSKPCLLSTKKLSYYVSRVTFYPFEPFDPFEIYLQHKWVQLFIGSVVQNGATGSPLAGRLFVVIGADDAGKALAYGAKAKGARIVIHNGTYDMAGVARAGYRYGFCGGNIVYEGKGTQPWTEEEDKMLVDALLELHVSGKFVHAHIESDYVNAVHQLIDPDKQYPDNFFSMNFLRHRMATIKDDF